MGISDFKFQPMLNRARVLRSQMAKRGSDEVIEKYVRDRLSWRPTVDLPHDESALAEEIIALLDEPRLSPQQAAQLERTFFGVRHSR